MSQFFSNLNKWMRKLHRWVVLPVLIIVVAGFATRGTPTGINVQRIQQISIIFMLLTGLYLYLYRQWSLLERRKRTNSN